MSLPQLNRKWAIHLIHHTHTDIGYTDHQSKIERFQIDYLKQERNLGHPYFTGLTPFDNMTI
jgi:hypothetical protein